MHVCCCMPIAKVKFLPERGWQGLEKSGCLSAVFCGGHNCCHIWPQPHKGTHLIWIYLDPGLGLDILIHHLGEEGRRKTRGKGNLLSPLVRSPSQNQVLYPVLYGQAYLELLL